MKRALKSELQLALSRGTNLLVVVALFSMVINLLMLTGPLYMLQVYDRVLTSGSVDTLIALTILGISLLFCQGILEYLRSRILMRYANRLDQSVSVSVLNAVVAHGMKRRNVSAAQALRDLDSFRSFFSGRGLISLFDVPWTPLFLLVIFLMHPMLGMVALVGAALLMTMTLISELITNRRFREGRASGYIADKFADSSLRNAEAIQAMGMMPAILERWRGYHQLAQSNQSRAGDRASLMTSAAKFIRPSLQIAMLGCGAWLVLQREITPGVMIAASIIMGRALAPVEAMIGSWRQIAQARSSYASLNELLGVASNNQEKQRLPRPTGTVGVEGVIAVPPGEKKPVLQGVTFALSPGDALGVIGPSAAGKSSLARVLVGAWMPASGSVRLDNADVSQWDAVERGPYIGYLPQQVELFDGTVRENIARMGAPDDEAVVAAGKASGAHDMILHLAEGYDTPIGEGGQALSAGQRQRVALARALYGLPAFVVLDEPNANLDQEGEQALRSAIMQMKKNRQTSIMIAHHTNILGVCDKLLVLRRGRVELFGPRDEVIGKLTRPVPDKGAAAAKPSVRAVDS